MFQAAENFTFVCTQSASSLTGVPIATRESCTALPANDGVNRTLLCPIVIPPNVPCPFLAFNSLAADITIVSLMYFGADTRLMRACIFVACF